MAILVDDARWPWRNTYWCHLVSDSHLAELHEFAGLLGCRRIGFQGDHYDIDVETRTQAIELGAIACNSRELVTRLKAAGLRLRPSSFAKWELNKRWDGPFDMGELIANTGQLSASHHALMRSLADSAATGAFALQRNGSIAAVIHGFGSPPPIDESRNSGQHVRIDGSGQWSVELVNPPLDDTE